ncbi:MULTISPECIES: hypothetical protein [unclassified Flavobacterium]|nr:MULTISPECIES: hypothetical protein [unclassified Flavobacterium]
MDNFKPNSNVNENYLIKILVKSWPKEYFREISDIEVIKDFYNTSYQNFHKEIEVFLDKYHPASWIRIAYIEIELWTLELLIDKEKQIEENNKIFAPIGRYGWRYIIEKSLEKLEESDFSSFGDKRPDDIDISKVFTLLLGLSYCKEISNYIHYFKNRFTTAKIVFSTTIYGNWPELEESERLFINDLMSFYNEVVDYDLVPELNYMDNKDLLDRIDLFLQNHFEFSLSEVDVIIKTLKERVAPEIGARILVMPTNALIVMLADYTSIEINRVFNLMNFILFEISNFNYEQRDFLKKSQNVRMLNFAGCRFDLNNNLKTIYEESALEFEFVETFENHCIISFASLAEWRVNFVERIIFGKRIDLKALNANMKNDISKIEDFFHRNVFENNIKNILINKGLPCISLEEVEKKKLPCGEIDALSIDEDNKVIYIIEAKNLAPIKDARASGNTISDHYKQKKYHSKFLKKIKWVEENLDTLSAVFKVQVSGNYKIEKYFVTGSPSPIKFLVSDYHVLTYYEYYSLINKKYG